VAREDRLAGTVFHLAPVTDGCKRPRSPKLPKSLCVKPRLVCSPPLKAYSPVRERALPRGTTAGSAGSHSVGKSGRDYFSTHNEQLYERNEASARGIYIWVTFKNVSKVTMLKLRWSDLPRPQRLEVPSLRSALLSLSRSNPP